MTQDQITQNNKLIAGFMGYVYDPGNDDMLPHWYDPAQENLLIAVVSDDGAPDFNSSWNELMPVVEKIETLWTKVDGRFGVHVYSNGCTIQGTKFRSDTEPHSYFLQMYGKTKIEATWSAAALFIQWHNQQSPE